MGVTRNPARVYNRGPWLVCTMTVPDGQKTREVSIHGRKGLLDRQPNLMRDMMRNGVRVADWEPMPEGAAPPADGIVLATPRVVIGTKFVQIRQVRPEDLTEEAA